MKFYNIRKNIERRILFKLIQDFNQTFLQIIGLCFKLTSERILGYIKEQLNRLVKGDFLELQFSQGKPFNYFRQKILKKGIAK